MHPFSWPNGRATSGMALFINKGYLFSQVQTNTPLQAVADGITLNKTFSLQYIPTTTSKEISSDFHGVLFQCYDPTQFKKETTNPVIINSPTWNIFQSTFTDGSKTNDGVAVSAVSSKIDKIPYACRLPGDGSIYTAELRAIYSFRCKTCLLF